MGTTNLPSLQEGDSGEGVRFLEQLLVCLYWTFHQKPGTGLIQTKVTFDGKYDSQTVEAVKEFQKNYSDTFPPPADNLKVDGVVGDKTWKALGDAVFRGTYRS